MVVDVLEVLSSAVLMVRWDMLVDTSLFIRGARLSGMVLQTCEWVRRLACMGSR